MHGIQAMSPWHLLLHQLPLPCQCGRIGPSPPQSCGCWSTQPSWRSRETQTMWVKPFSHASRIDEWLSGLSWQVPESGLTASLRLCEPFLLKVLRLTMLSHISFVHYSTANTCLSTLDRPTPPTATRSLKLWTSGRFMTSSQRRRVGSKSSMRKALRTPSS